MNDDAAKVIVEELIGPAKAPDEPEWDGDTMRELATDEARDILQALDIAGFRVVPVSFVDAARDVADPSVDWAHGGGISLLGVLDRELDELDGRRTT